MTEPRDPSKDDIDPASNQPRDKDNAGNDSHGDDNDAIAVRAEPVSWETVLARAEETERRVEPMAHQRATIDAERRAQWAHWAKLAVPLLILVVYAGYKFSQRAPRDPRPMQVDQIASVSGVRPSMSSTAMDREVSALTAELEQLRLARDWTNIRLRIEQAPEGVRQHPVIEAFHLVARVRMGQRTPEVSNRVKALQPLFAEDRNRRGLYDLLLLAEAEVLYTTTTTPEAALRQADTYRTIFQRMGSYSQDAIDFRVRLANRYAEHGDRMASDAGRFRVDKAKLSDARALYQNALRWVVRPEGWRDLQPIATGNAQAARDRIVLRLADANARFHGSAMPFTGRDSRTWTGQSGDPTHDRPNGTW